MSWKKEEGLIDFREKMPPAGTFRWETAVSVGPKPRAKHWRHLLPVGVAGTSRGRMGKREDHVETNDAKRKRDERDEGGDVFKVILSQLRVARRRKPNPARETVLEKYKTGDVCELKRGDKVFFVRPGPGKWSKPCVGDVVAFPDRQKRFVAVDRGQYSHRSLLCDIEVVPVSDVWAA